MSDFKIGDTIKPKKEMVQNAKARGLFRSLRGKIIDFLGDEDQRFPIIENQDGDLLTVNPDIYEIAEAK